jgi:uncharacterized membrane protein YeaQ/YmgE (transglycosylase-associated protein family)
VDSLQSSGALRNLLARCAQCSEEMHILYMLLIGLVVGALAKLVMPGRDPGGIIITMLIGIAGSMLAGFIGREMNWYHHSQPAGFIASIGGAMLLLFVYRLVVSRRA